MRVKASKSEGDLGSAGTPADIGPRDFAATLACYEGIEPQTTRLQLTTAARTGAKP